MTMRIYQVGGAVRDELLGMPVKERDWVVVGGTPGELAALGYKPVGKDFPVFIHPQSGEEYALARTERKTGPGYRGFAFNAAPGVTLEEDLRRRDLTVNAIARDENGALVDPCGGRRDLEKKILRHVSPAFVEDPLRVLRAARFGARFGFSIAAETQALLREIVAAGELETLAPERVWAETEKALGTPRPRRYFEILRDCAALARLFPEVDQLFGVPQPERHHPEIDSGIHTLMALEQSARLDADPAVRFAALVHDLGKGATPPSQRPSHRGHERRGQPLVNALCERLRVPKKYRALALLVTRYHLDCHRVGELRPATVLNRLEALDAFRRPERFAQFLLACEADARGRLGLEERDYPQAGWFAEYLEACRRVPVELPAGERDGAAIARHVRRRRLGALRAARAKIAALAKAQAPG